MVKVLLLGLLAASMCALVGAASVPQTLSSVEDPAVRSERSTNLSHINSISRKIQMYVRNNNLQLLPDGTVNGTTDDDSVYTILQRTTVGIGQLKIQGVATCQYLCMDSCGLLYGSRHFSDECVFNEMILQHHYNTYSSTKYSNERRTLYLALNGRGQPRKVMLRANQQLGRLSFYTRVLTRQPSSHEREEELHPTRHHSHMCASTVTAPATRGAASTPTDPPPTDTHRCRKRKKRKKKKRKCADGDPESELCHKRQTAPNRKTVVKLNSSNSTRKCDVINNDECQRVKVTEKKRHKTNKFGEKATLNGAKKKKKHPKGARKKARVITTTEAVVTDETTSDEDYTLENTTAWDWEDSTAMYEESSTPYPD